MSVYEVQLEQAKKADGFLAALDQSGGSTPKALKAYGIPDDSYVAGEESMYDMVHSMRTRIITSECFTGDKILGAILFENTMDRQIEGKPTPSYLWEEKKVIPFLKCDKGLAELGNGVQIMKPNPGLDTLLARAKSLGVFGTKMRSVIKEANDEGIQAIVDQQFEVGKQILAAGLMPILEPEVDITSPDKEKIEEILNVKLLAGLDALADGQEVMLKLSLPTVVNKYSDLIAHPKCVRVVALSGGYSREEANKILVKQEGMIASFSRALMEGVYHTFSNEEFNKKLGEGIDSIFDASKKL